ncbi:TetR/AcrR family transcriptional regulator [Kineococcus rhizosphaerae]|uniref:TetR family transcriptional regulator n=1 Tax=Kineococcus rhizosphaerae TaxID=559628 RepID=A0A2T0QZG9_9ACTN|nr:TetR-like C-terminal domain-containing protein [Kineococcus rhizosphaerae]PRY12061.1 TetR family transcriptional regulator [Kineococcus rhizosphaerae]
MPRAGLDRARLVRAGAELADEAGFAGVTLSALAARFGVRPASLYAHVGGLADLSAGITALALDELADRVGADLAGRQGRDALAAYARAHRTYAHEHPGRYEAARAPLAEPSPDAVRAGGRNADLAFAVLRGYALPESEQVHAVRFLGATVHGFTALHSAFGHRAPDLEDSWERALDVLDAALRGWPTPGG